MKVHLTALAGVNGDKTPFLLGEMGEKSSWSIKKGDDIQG